MVVIMLEQIEPPFSKQALLPFAFSGNKVYGSFSLTHLSELCYSLAICTSMALCSQFYILFLSLTPVSPPLEWKLQGADIASLAFSA